MKILLIISLIVASSLADYPLLPNCMYIGTGYDTRIGTPMESLRMPVLLVNMEKMKLFYDGPNVYNIPVSLYAIPIPSVDKQENINIYYEEQEITTSLKKTYSVGFSFWGEDGMFNYSRQVDEFKYYHSKDNRYTAYSYLNIKLWEVTFSGMLILDPGFKYDIDRIPDQYNTETAPIFNKLFGKYGTHSAISAIFGGSLQMDTSFATSLVYSKSTKQISSDLHMQFALLTSDHDLSYDEQKELQRLNDMYYSKFSLIGGLPNLYNQTEWRTWANSIPKNPTYVSMNLVPLWSLLDEQNSNKTQALQKATTAYLLS